MTLSQLFTYSRGLALVVGIVGAIAFSSGSAPSADLSGGTLLAVLLLSMSAATLFAIVPLDAKARA